MKYSELKKRLLIESIVAAAILAVAGGVTFFLDDFSDDYKKSNEALKGNISTITNTTNALNAKYEKIQTNKALIKQILELQSEDKLNINPQMTQVLFNRLRDKYYLNGLHLSMLPIVETPDARFKRATYSLVSSEDTISFDALSDEYAYSLIDAIQQQLPGSVEIANVKLTRTGTVTTANMHTIGTTGTAPLVKGDIKFIWFGIKPMESSDSTNAPKPKP
jgi:hypothetical protein